MKCAEQVHNFHIYIGATDSESTRILSSANSESLTLFLPLNFEFFAVTTDKVSLCVMIDSIPELSGTISLGIKQKSYSPPVIASVRSASSSCRTSIVIPGYFSAKSAIHFVGNESEVTSQPSVILP